MGNLMGRKVVSNRLEQDILHMNPNWKRNTALFLASQTVSLFGSSLVQYAIIWEITLGTQSGLMMTISIICGFLPTFFVSPFAGVWADRYDRKTIIILADSLIAVATLVLAILFLTGHRALWQFFLISAIRALGTGIQKPAVGAFLPQIVPQDRLTKVNATNSSINSTVNIVSPMVAGALMTKASIEAILFIDVITAAIAVFILLSFLRVPAHERPLVEQKTSYFDDMRKGFDFINQNGFLKSFCWLNVAFLVLIAPAAFLTPLQVTRSFGDDVWRLTAIEITFSGGMIVGGLIMVAWDGLRNKVHTMVLANLAVAVGVVLLGVVTNFWLYLFMMAFIGLAVPVFNTVSTVILQHRVSGEYLGRVFGIFGMIASISMPVGMLVFGPMADYVSVESLLIGTGIGLLIQGFMMMGNKDLVAAGEPVVSESSRLGGSEG